MSMTNVTCLRFVDKCILVILCVVALGGATAWGATFGNTTGTLTTTGSIENRIILSRFTLSEDGIADSITAHINNTFSTKSIRYALYRVMSVASDDSVRLVAWTDIASVSTGDQWKGIAFNPKPLLFAGSYYIGAHSSSGAGINAIFYAVSSGEKKAHRTLGSFDSTAVYTGVSHIFDADTVNAIYCTYTASTDGIFGDTVLGATALTTEAAINAGVWQTPAKAIIIDSAAWWFNLSTHAASSGTRAAGAGLYLEADSSRLDYSDSVSIQLNGNGDRYRVFRFVNKPTIAASTRIFPAIWSDTTYGSFQIMIENSTGNGWYLRDPYSWKNNGPGTWPTPLGATKVANYKIHCLLYYHNAPSTKPRRRKIMLGQPLGMVREATETFAGSVDAITR